MTLKGIVPSLNTPFKDDGTVDHHSLRRLVNHTIDAGCGGMLCLAVAGEYSTLTKAEKVQIVETISDANADRIPFIVSVTAQDLNESRELAKVAKSVHATGICVQLPEGLDLSEKLDFLRDLTQEAPELLMVQDLDWHGAGLPLDEIVYLFENIEQFQWLKIETQQAGPKYSAVIEATNGALNVCGGWAVTQLMDAMARDVDAFIPTGMEHVYVAIYSLHKDGRIAAARDLFDRVLPILNFSNQHIDTSIRFFKALRKAEGLFETNICRISTELDPVQQAELEHTVVSALDLIRDSQREADLAN
ncbi:MAG: dihydrodipicolinate synthase family protein [Pseudomonadota bacterium]